MTKIFGPERRLKRDITERIRPLQVIEEIELLLHECVVSKYQHMYREHYASFGKVKMREYAAALEELEAESGQEIFHLHLRIRFSSRVVCEEYQFTPK